MPKAAAAPVEQVKELKVEVHLVEYITLKKGKGYTIKKTITKEVVKKVEDVEAGQELLILVADCAR